MKILLADYPQIGARPPRLAALEALGHDVCYFDHSSDRLLSGRLGRLLKRVVRKVVKNPQSIPGIARAEATAVNKSFLGTLRDFRPDLIFVGKGSMLGVETLKTVREQLKIPMICQFGEPLCFAPHAERAIEVAPYYDAFYLLDEIEVLNEVPLAGNRISVAPHAADPAIFHPVTLNQEEEGVYGCDVAFIGVVRENRLPILRAVAQLPVRFKIWGMADLPEPEWRRQEPDVARCLAGSFQQEEMATIHSGARIALNVHGRYPRGGAYDGLPMRVFEQTASGAFVLSDEGVQVRRCFAVGEEVDVYDSPEALCAKVSYYLGHEACRREMAERGRRRTLRDHTYEVRIREMIARARETIDLPA